MIIRFNSDIIRFGFCIFFIAAITIRTDMAFIDIEKIFDTCILFLITTFVINLKQIYNIVEVRIPQIDTELANLKTKILAAEKMVETINSGPSMGRRH